MKVLGVRTWLVLNRGNLRRNYRFFRGHIGRRAKLMAVVKSNAYGHGLIGTSKELQRLGVDWFGVDSIVEALSLRHAGIRKPILVLGHTLPENFEKAFRAGISLTISTREGLRHAKRAGVTFHLKIDTGMHRQGFLLEELPRVLSEITRLKIRKSQFQGLYTHLAAPASKKFKKRTKSQIALFVQAASLVEREGFRPLRHAAATGGTLLFPEAHFDMVRI